MIPRRNPALLILIVCLLGIGSAIFFYRKEKPQSAAEEPKLNFVVISIDTTRADSIGIYGNQKIQTPNIDSIGRSGMVFKNAVAHVPLTLPSHASLLTGLLPAKHGIRDNHGYRLNAATPTLPSMLKRKNYKTAAFLSSIVLDHRFGLSNGFDLYDDFIQYGTQDSTNPQNERLAETTTSAATNWISSNQQFPFFLLIHYYDPHARYRPPEPFLTRYSYNPYFGEIAYVDEQIGKLFEILKSIRNNTMILITSDHGEGLGDHDELGHGLFLYDSTIHIPFLMAGPGIPSKEISQQIQLIDVVPTILELVGIQKPTEIDGRSLVPLFSGKSWNETSAILETQYPLATGWSPLYSARTSQWKIINAPVPEIYDLKRDPKEITNRNSTNDPTLRSLSDKLQKYKKLMPTTQSAKTDPELEEQLRSLGYLSGSTKPKTLENLPDPKSKIEIWKLYESATFLSMDGKQNEAVELLERAATLDSTNPILFDTLGQFVIHTDPKKAVEYWQKALRMNPEDSKIHHRIALGFKRLGDIEKFIIEEKIALKIDPEMQEALISLGETLAATGKPQEAIPYLQKSLELDPRNAPAAYELGNAYRNLGDFARAAEQYEKAIEFNPSLAHPYYALAILKGQQGDLNTAEQLLKSALERNPQFAEAYYNLGIILERQERIEEAKQAYQNFIAYADPQLHASRIETARKKIGE